VIQSGVLESLNIDAGQSRIVTLPIKHPNLIAGAEYWLEVRFTLPEANAWASAGHEVAFEQFAVPYQVPVKTIRKLEDLPNIDLRESKEYSVVTGPEFYLFFDKEQGKILTYRYLDQEIIQAGPTLNAWRAPTDNDAAAGRRGTEWLWYKAGLDQLEQNNRKSTVTKINDKTVVIAIEAFCAAPGAKEGFQQSTTYTVFGNGEMLVDTHIKPVGDLPPLPRLGMTMTIAGEFNRFSWYGRGPQENYCDRKTGARISRYTGSVDEQFVPYIKPSENGNKTDVRWVALTNDKGMGLLAVGSPYFETSAHHYTAKDMANAKHPQDLRRRDEIIFNLDSKQMGVGGDDSWTPLTVHPPYRVMPTDTTFRFRLVPCQLTDAFPEAATYEVPVVESGQ
jgi:beta-galactosidase